MTGDDEPKLPVFLTPIEVARMLRYEPRTLEKWRLEGRGPRYFRIGDSGKAKVVYRLTDIEEWLELHRR
jgi:hypothetical protein